MRKEKIGKIEVEFFDGIDEMLIERFHIFNKYLLIDSAIGSTPQQIDSHIEKIAKYIHLKDDKHAITELMNMRQNLHFVLNSVSPEHLSFACLISKIDNESRTDLSENGLKETLFKLKDGLNVGLIGTLLSLIKKKIDKEIELFFPEMGNSSKTKEYFSKVKSRTLKILEKIIDNKDNEKTIEELENEIFLIFKPKRFTGKESEEIQYIKQFEEMCYYVTKQSGRDAKKMTVLEFYQAFELIKKENKPKNGRK
jgi:hypothetical protein